MHGVRSQFLVLTNYIKTDDQSQAQYLPFRLPGFPTAIQCCFRHRLCIFICQLPSVTSQNLLQFFQVISLAWKCQSFNFHIYNIKSIKFISRGRYSTCAVSFVDTLYIIGNLIVQEMHCRIYTQKIFKRRSNQPWWTREYQPE